MKIYFEDGVLTATQHLKLGCKRTVNASTGYSNNVDVLNKWKYEYPENDAIYTNSLAALSNHYCWNDELGIPELYIRSSKTNEFVRVDELTNRELRAEDDLLNLYLSGEFNS